MKTIIKKITCMSLNLILAAGLIFVTAMFTTGCGDDDNKTTPAQTRVQHGTFGSIPVWHEVGVSDTDMDKIWGYLEGLQADQDWIDDGNTALLESQLDEIQVHPGSDLIKDGRILKIGTENVRSSIVNYMVDIAYGLVATNRKNILPVNGYNTMEQQMMANWYKLNSVRVKG